MSQYDVPLAQLNTNRPTENTLPVIEVVEVVEIDEAVEFVKLLTDGSVSEEILGIRRY